MRQPVPYTAEYMVRYRCFEQKWNGEWIPTRPIGHTLFPMWWRWKVSFLVLIGKYDALDWRDKEMTSERMKKVDENISKKFRKGGDK